MKYKLMLTNGKDVIVETEKTLLQMSIEVNECRWISNTESGGLIFTNHIVGIEVQDDE